MKDAVIPLKSAVKGTRFLSLKWKAVLIFSLVLISVNTGLAVLGYWQLREQFSLQQAQINQQHIQELEALIGNSFKELEQIASLIPTMLPATSSSEPMSIRLADMFLEQSATLEFDWGLDDASFFSNQNKLLFSLRPPVEIERLIHMVQQVNLAEQPEFLLKCIDQCKQYVAIPVLNKGQKNGVLLLSRLIADAIISFKDITGADIAVISEEINKHKQRTEARLLNDWEQYIVALTNPETNMQLLQDISERYRFEQFQRSGSEIEHHGKHLMIQSLQMSNEEIGRNMHFILINDITESVQHINQATKKNISFGLVGFLLSETLLLILLWRPLNRLLLLSRSLPLLAHNAYSEVRKKLEITTRYWHKDEIDIAGETTLELTNTLESLHKEVQEQTNSLITRGEELAQERDFVTGLLNSAQVIILTQDCDGQLLTLNSKGKAFLSRVNTQSKNAAFHHFISEESNDESFQQAIEKLKTEEISSYQHDSHINTSDNTNHTISWVHSRLSGKRKPGSPIILSVGLDITDREEAERRLTWLANHDPLTGLYNRRYFQNTFEDLLSMAQRYSHNIALLFFDLDQFKYVNDSSGHQAGDAMLRVVAEKLVQITRETDLLARLGGDEFAVVIPEAGIDGAIQVAEKILETLKQISLPTEDCIHRISASIGIVMYPEHGNTAQDLMSNSDLAMYQAKESGRDRWHLFALDDQIREQMSERVIWKNKIEQALVNSAFLLYYQPILEIKSGRISHYEVLIRMRESDGGIATPGHFIPVAERTGLIHSIDRFVLREAISQLAKISKISDTEINFSINLSGRVVDDPELLPLLKQLLNQSGVKPQNLVFELTETATLANMASAEQLMRELRSLGCRFAMDDFGVGFSSFYYLRELPLDIVKIDGSFIRQLPTSPEDQIFVKALTEMASGLNKLTVAEFVEDEATLNLLAEIGVDYAQGYYIGKPQPEILPIIGPAKSSSAG
ncbi:MAG: EAL domain-containing protein [Pseudomonadota bacterium]